MGVPREIRALYQRRELGPAVWLQWAQLDPTEELLKALRLEEANARYSTGAAFDIEARAKADGLSKAIQIIERFTKKVDTGEE